MFTIRSYREHDAVCVGRLIADTYTSFNLTYITNENLPRYLGPYAYAYSTEPSHQQVIADVIGADMVFVATVDDDNEEDISVGVLRGRIDKLQSLFVSGNFQRQGIGSELVRIFEQTCITQGSSAVKVQSTLYAVPFYLAMGYKRTTGIRRMTSFEEHGLLYQPMKKVFPDSSEGE